MYKGNLQKHLRAFVATARSGSVSTAAKQLFLSQPSISQQIRALEDELGQTLFERRGPKLHLTPAGEALFEMAQPIIRQLDSLPDDFSRRYGSLDHGTIRLAAGESTIMHLLPPLLMRFRRLHPGIAIDLQHVSGTEGLKRIRQNDVDFAVGSMVDAPDDIAYQPIYEFKPVLIAALDHPLARRRKINLQDISPYGLILPPKRRTSYQMIDLVFQRHGLPYRVTLEIGGWEVIKRYVSLGMGISIVTSICITEADRERLVVRDLSEFFPSRTYGVVMREGAYLSPQSQRFVSLMNRELFRSIDSSERTIR